MAKVSAPLFGFSASGTIGKAVTFGTIRGVAYARQRVKPTNPNTTEQQATRGTFAGANASWRGLPSTLRDPWDVAAQGTPRTGRNAYMGHHTKALRGSTTLAPLQISPGNRSAGSLDTVAIAPGAAAGEISVAYGVPTAPAGWTLTAVRLAIIQDRGGDDVSSWDWSSQDDTTLSGTVTVSGLVSGAAYYVAAFPVWTRPDGKIAHGASAQAVVIAT